MSVSIYSPTAGTPIRLKVEDSGDPTISVETEAVTTVANEWETLVFDFSNEATGTAALNLGYSYNKASIFFNFGTTGAQAGEQTYLWDNLYFSIPTGIDENLISQLQVYPNPAIDVINIVNYNELTNINIYSLTGNLVYSSKEVASTIVVSELKPGTYLISATDFNGRINRTMIIVN